MLERASPVLCPKNLYNSAFAEEESSPREATEQRAAQQKLFELDSMQPEEALRRKPSRPTSSFGRPAEEEEEEDEEEEQTEEHITHNERQRHIVVAEDSGVNAQEEEERVASAATITRKKGLPPLQLDAVANIERTLGSVRASLKELAVDQNVTTRSDGSATRVHVSDIMHESAQPPYSGETFGEGGPPVIPNARVPRSEEGVSTLMQ